MVRGKPAEASKPTVTVKILAGPSSPAAKQSWKRFWKLIAEAKANER
jgi:hypothetical protein